MSGHALVTGAASGIGKEIARALAARGYRLHLVDFDGGRLEQAAAELTGLPGSGVTVGTQVLDLREAGAAEEAAQAAWEAAPVDVLVNAAGIYPAVPLLELGAGLWDAVQAVNVRAPVLLTVALARRAVAAGTRPNVVNISSGAALRARPGAAPYTTSKAALEMATKAAALELGQHGIRVNAVAPGFVEVDSTVNPLREDYAAAVAVNPLGRTGRPEDIARAVLWLAGPEAEWITGEVLRVDGGAAAGALNLPLHWDSPRTETEA
ncbi:SDR family NAD(P)-dependent oxidoreductase [Sediminivirga luteola]|uniref:SDR family NAD(P)-dependent oxidoreductase n=1 Tax=Sediminivirga luteola TaxID=1774748 RepID=UPI001F579F8F|nr:SDR family oxidoreductase [Sediminivirga luteola]MCI2265926.1 SDR family oxidoreductase [Sediminivirga luteola]